jgi:hypothetical protein
MQQLTKELPQYFIDAIHKLIRAGSPPEAISFALGIDIEQVRQIQPIDPSQTSRLVNSIKEKSSEFRCVLSKRLMVEEQVDRPPNTTQNKISEFSKESLTSLAPYFKQIDVPEDVLELTAECLSVLILACEIETVLRVLDSVEEEVFPALLQKLGDFVRRKDLLSLLARLVEDQPSKGLCLGRMILMGTKSRRVFDEALHSFISLLSQASLSGVIDLAEEIAGRMSSTQLGGLNSALAQIGDVEGRLDGLRLKEAWLLLSEGEEETAKSIVKSLNPSMKVLKFYEKAGWQEDKLLLLGEILSTSLDSLRQESPEMADTLSLMQQYTELQSQRSEAAINALRAQLLAGCTPLEEKIQRTEAGTQQSLSELRAEVKKLQLHKLDDLWEPTYICSYQANTDQLTRTHLNTGEQSCHRVPAYKFKEHCCWSEVPGGSLLITGGLADNSDATNEVVRIDGVTLRVSCKPPMLVPRGSHTAVSSLQHVYVLGGESLSSSERYWLDESRWEALPALPRVCRNMSAVVAGGSLFVLGTADVNLIQQLRLEGLTWEARQLTLPYADYGMPCFKVQSQVYFVLKKSLYSLFPVRQVKTLAEEMCSRGPCYFSRGTLYCCSEGGVATLPV